MVLNKVFEVQYTLADVPRSSTSSKYQLKYSRQHNSTRLCTLTRNKEILLLKWCTGDISRFPVTVVRVMFLESNSDRIASYVASIVSLYLPQVLPVKDLGDFFVALYFCGNCSRSWSESVVSCRNLCAIKFHIEFEPTYSLSSRLQFTGEHK